MKVIKVDAKIVGKKIAELRKKNNMTQKELASKLNVIDKTVSRWECGYGLPDLAIIPEIATVFNISSEELLGKNNDYNEVLAESMEKTPKEEIAATDEEAIDISLPPELPKKSSSFKKKWIALCCSSFAVFVCVLIVIFCLPKPPRYAINGHCWELANESEADYVFITAFGLEECMTLTLNGNETQGEFFCQETWRESVNSTPLSCAVYGNYNVSFGKINFYTEGVVDDKNTKKLRMHTALGLERFSADIEYDEEGNITAIVFASTVKNSESSVFGRWTKYANYFSREKGEIYFECVADEISYDQYLRLPNWIVVDMEVTVPYRMEVYLDRYSYYVGEIIRLEQIKVMLVYSDGTQKRINNATCEQANRELTIGDECLNIYHTVEGVKKMATVYIEVSYGFAWERAKESAADLVYFTHYNTDDAVSFGSLELFGDQKQGRFVYSENFGVSKLSNAAVVTGHYKYVDGELRFISACVLSYRNYLPKFYINAEGDYFTAYAENDFAEIYFQTGQLARNLFGHYVTEQKETSFSQMEGTVCFEAVENEALSQRAQGVVEYYKKMYE